MNNNEVSMNEAFDDLKKDLESGQPLSHPPYKVRAAKPMLKEEFASIRKRFDVTQAQLAEILDVSIKTVQAYEQGRADVPGLVAKVLRLMDHDTVFRGIFKGVMAKEDYSDYVRIQNVLDLDIDMNKKVQLAETLIRAVNDLQDDNVNVEIMAMTKQPSFIVNSEQ